MFNLIKRSLWLIATIIQLFGGTLFGQQANKPNATTTPGATIPISTHTAYSQAATLNYVRVWEPMGLYTLPQDVIDAGNQDVRLTTKFLDGLGRPLQIVSRQSSPTAKDVVAPVEYDEFGREVYKYLPYVQTTGTNNGFFKLNPFNEQTAFYQSSTYNPDLTNEQVFFSQTNYESSPLNRVTKSMAPGNSWTGTSKGTIVDYQVNTVNDNVIIWSIGYDILNNINDDATSIPIAGSPYGQGELFKNVRTDENNNAIVEYKDKHGQVVLKKVQAGNNAAQDKTGYTGFLSTYYIYDDLNQLRCVIPPKAVEGMLPNNWSLNVDIIKELCFRYEYDTRQRIIAKKVPGAGWVYMVYDKRDRLVFTQDANLRDKNQWMTTLYDGLNRPVTTGITTYSGNREQLQGIVDAQTGNGSAGTVIVHGSGDSNLEIDIREINRGEYKASQTITFLPGFVSEDGSEFIAEIDPSLPGASENIEVIDNPLPPNNPFIALTITYYDKYDNWVGSRTYSTSDNGKLDAGTNLHGELLPNIASQLTTRFVTGTKVRVLENPADLASGEWLTMVSYYDDKGRTIQVQADNYKRGKEVVTTMYDFTGKVLNTYLLHQNPTAGTPETRVETNMVYDFAGRLLEIIKTINDNSNSTVTITKHEYDELGQLKKKELGQKKNGTGYTSVPIGTFDYSYNIRGWLIGMNKEYANGTGSGIGTDRWFGMQLNYDYGFDKNQFNGNIAGTKWRSEGDGQQRAYGYTYDTANRLLGADFSEGSGINYANNPIINFDMVMGDGINAASAYDANGNIQKMKQMGMKGLNASTMVDNLEYTYFGSGNKLKAVTEMSGAVDHKLGDFTDNNSSGDDYGYDPNGNMVTDRNKRIGTNIGEVPPLGGAIRYNHLNLPAQVNIADASGSAKGTIVYIYDAAGNKLEKRVHENPSVANNNKISDITTTYIAGFTYESKTVTPLVAGNENYTDKLLFFTHEEGRVRVDKSPTGERVFNYDYFVKDQLDNVRVVLTDEKKEVSYLASMETTVRTNEEQVFQNVGSTATAAPHNYPSDPNGLPNEMVSMLNGTTKKIGPALVLKVMSGDRFNINVNSFYRAPEENVNPASLLPDILAALATGIVGNIGDLKGKVEILSDIAGPFGSAMSSLLNDQAEADGSKPKAFLNYVFFDEQFNKMPNSGFIQVGGPNLVVPRCVSNLLAPKNGFVYIYVSNQSANWNVYFDNLQVQHIKSPLMEETHYYPFGLTMAGISSKSVGTLENKYEYNEKEKQEKEFADGSGLDWYAYGARFYDVQTGRYAVQDLLSEKMYNESPYHYCYNNPISHIDLLGLAPVFRNGSYFDGDRELSWNEVQNWIKENDGISGTIKFGKVESEDDGISSSAAGSEQGAIGRGRTFENRSELNGTGELGKDEIQGYRILTPESFKYTKLTSATYEAGVSGLYIELSTPGMTKRWNFQTLFVQFPKSLKDGTSYKASEAAKRTTWGFNEASTTVGIMLVAVRNPTLLSNREVQDMFVKQAKIFVSYHAGGQATITNRSFGGSSTIISPAIWFPK
jgi:RHS repeat-associated protein